jgi:hypothetical protein
MSTFAKTTGQLGAEAARKQQSRTPPQDFDGLEKAGWLDGYDAAESPMIVSVTYVNPLLRQQERRDHEVADLERSTIEAVVDLFDSQVGTVLSVYAEGRCLHRSAARLSDFL